MSPGLLVRTALQDRDRLCAWLRRHGMGTEPDPASLSEALRAHRADGPALSLTHADPAWPQWNEFSEKEKTK